MTTALRDIVEGLLAAMLDNADTLASMYQLLDREDQDAVRVAAVKLYEATGAERRREGELQSGGAN